MEDIKNYEGWDTKEHLDVFNRWNKLSNKTFNFIYSNFQENRYLLDILQKKRAKNIIDIGCATGTTYRLIDNKINEKFFNYKGYDISKTAVNFAKNFHNKNFFYNIEDSNYENLPSDEREIIYTRDTIMHQVDPFDFLKKLISLTSKFLIIRLRTRDNGKTEWDISRSKQRHYDKYWMPYIVININELVDLLLNYRKPKCIKINRSYLTLGGETGKYLPEDLFYSHAGGSETSVCIEYDQNINIEPKIDYTEILEGQKFLIKNKKKQYFYRIIDFLKIKKKLLKYY